MNISFPMFSVAMKCAPISDIRATISRISGDFSEGFSRTTTSSLLRVSCCRMERIVRSTC